MPKFDVALIVLYDARGRVLLQQRSLDAEILPGYWAFFGGRINSDEKPQEAVCREAYEELNCRLHSPQLMLKQRFKEGSASGYLYVFIEGLPNAGSSLKLQEGQAWGWYKAEEVYALKMVNRDRKIIKGIFRYLKNKKSQDRRAYGVKRA